MTEKFAFQQPPKYRQWRCTLRRWRQTVPDARTSDTECTVAYGSPSRPRDVQSGRGRGLQPSVWLQGCHRLQLVSKVWRSSTTETTENKHRKFELNALRYRQSVPTLDLGIPGLPPLSSSHIPSLPPLPPSFTFPRGPTPKPARGSGGAL